MDASTRPHPRLRLAVHAADRAPRSASRRLLRDPSRATSRSSAIQRVRARARIILSGGPRRVYDDGAPHAPDGLLELRPEAADARHLLRHAAPAQSLGGEVEQARRARVRPRGGAVEQRGAALRGIGGRRRAPRLDEPRRRRRRAAHGLRARRRRATTRAVRGDGEHRAPRSTASSSIPRSCTPARHRDARNFLFGVCRRQARLEHGARRRRAGREASARRSARRPGRSAALSGGVDSSVAAALIHRAIGDRLHCIFVDNGLLRNGEREQVDGDLPRPLPPRPVTCVDAAERFLAARGRHGPREEAQDHRRRVHRGLRRAEAEAARARPEFLAQGTLYPDVIESRLGSRAPSRRRSRATTTSAACPSACSSQLVEPLRELFKDEVRELGRELGVPRRHPVGASRSRARASPCAASARSTPSARRSCAQADAIFIEEIRAAGLYDNDLAGVRVLLPVEDRRRDGRRPHVRERRRAPRGDVDATA